MKVTAIVQAHMGSRRLPGKVMLKLENQTVLAHVIARLKWSRKLDEIVVATSTLAQDQCIAEEAVRNQVHAFRGSEEHVLERFYQAACNYQSDVIVRITADCPFIDPGMIDRMLEVFLSEGSTSDYMSNTLERTFPRGLDVEIFTMHALDKAYRQAERDDEKEHVTLYLYRHPEQFRLCSFTNPIDYSKYRWTLDTREDWLFVQEVYRRIYINNPLFTWTDIIQLLEREPSLSKINEGVQQKGVGT
ncbi:3-deoxy-manno-octulosonate cytidylyltransferase [Collibacillus ludicampi]|uniref:3-deoxy-manno-octulosonate cytidylyltransferase n=1 Tax=Collibacillus ludicampi TaxID=2771369 RepID=A0AAV4LF86_9BACL|nr:glycosyltransferase family protein [Collibacillus ludicampi]GIM46477.1 3-deoxy-manno-octulosonate cytidylyltransferase [Collibacillus ludicampi]